MLQKLISVFALSAVTFVCTAEKGQSIMFEKQEYPITQAPADEATSLGDRCQALIKKIESLKGNPQRRHAAKQAFDLECTDKHQDAIE